MTTEHSQLRTGMMAGLGGLACVAMAAIVYFAGLLPADRVAPLVQSRHPWSDNTGVIGRLSDPAFVASVTDRAAASAGRAGLVVLIAGGMVLAIVLVPRRRRMVPVVALLLVQVGHGAYELRHNASTAQPRVYDLRGAPPETRSRILVPPYIAQPNALVGTPHGNPAGYDPLYPGRLGDLVNAAQNRPLTDHPGAITIPTPLRLSAVVGITHAFTPEGRIQPLPAGYGGPRATLHARAVWVADRQQAHQHLSQRWSRLRPDEPDQGYPVLELSGGSPSASSEDDFAAEVSDAHAAATMAPPSAAITLITDPATPNRLTLLLDPPTTGILVLRDSYLPGWTATADGRTATIHAANLAYRGLVLRQPTARIEWHYSPPGSYAGGLLSLTALIILAAMGVIGRRELRRTDPA